MCGYFHIVMTKCRANHIKGGWVLLSHILRVSPYGREAMATGAWGSALCHIQSSVGEQSECWCTAHCLVQGLSPDNGSTILGYILSLQVPQFRNCLTLMLRDLFPWWLTLNYIRLTRLSITEAGKITNSVDTMLSAQAWNISEFFLLELVPSGVQLENKPCVICSGTFKNNTRGGSLHLWS